MAIQSFMGRPVPLPGFAIKDLGIQSEDINWRAVTSGKIAPQAVLTSNLQYGIGKRVQYRIDETLTDGAVVSINRSGYINVTNVHVSSRMPAIGVLVGDTNSGDTAIIQTEGPLASANWNFSGYVGDGVYVDASGGLRAGTSFAQSGLIQQMGVIDTHSSIFVNKDSLIVV